MSRLVPSEIIEEIKARLDIVDIVSEHVVLKRTPKNFSYLLEIMILPPSEAHQLDRVLKMRLSS